MVCSECWGYNKNECPVCWGYEPVTSEEEIVEEDGVQDELIADLKDIEQSIDPTHTTKEGE